jgi:nuclear polyadenylated RNA-binding protein NAB2
MPVEVVVGTPLATAIQTEIQPKLMELGWVSDPTENTLSEYIVLMLINGKTESEIASELSSELLGLDPNDPGAKDFSRWLFEQINTLANAGKVDDLAASQDDSATLSDDQKMDMDLGLEGDAAQAINAYVFLRYSRPLESYMLTNLRPKGPKAMREGGGRGGRGNRMFNQINRAMDRVQDSVLHRVGGQSGNGRINTHGRTPPSGPRMVARRGNMNNRAASIAHGLMGAPSPAGPVGVNPGMNGMNGSWMMPGQAPPQELYAMLEHQSNMMAQMQRQMQQQQHIMMQQQRGQGGFGRGGRPLSERVQHQNRNHRQGGHQQNGHGSLSTDQAKVEGDTEGADIDMTGAKREAPNPDETVCKYNLGCTNKDCKFAHQSPAAPPGVTIDVSDVCSFGAACKNRKCVGRHPSPAAKMAHQGEQDCKFWPNCTNPRCPFRHPSMPPCRNGADCAVPGCKFTHVKTMCKFNPCTNRFCTFKHEDGQRGTFQDKVWTADGTKEHVSERKFVDDAAVEDTIIPEQDKEMAAEETDIV